jgi:hypothetical protein
MDVARWAIPGATLPTEVWSLGGRFGYQDQGQTPNCQLSVYKFGEVLLVFETRGIVEKHEGFPRVVRNEYYTTEGLIRGGKFYPRGEGQGEPISGGSPRRVTCPGEPFAAFIAAVRSRSDDHNNCNAAVGHYSSALCHLGNVSYRLGTPVPFDKSAAALGDNKVVVESFQKIRDNCRAVGMELSQSHYRLGRVLRFDPETETCVGDEEANRLLTRVYRQPFTVPDDLA